MIGPFFQMTVVPKGGQLSAYTNKLLVIFQSPLLVRRFEKESSLYKKFQKLVNQAFFL